MSVFPHDISKNDAAIGSPNLQDTQMFHDEFWKAIYFGVTDLIKMDQNLKRYLLALSTVGCFNFDFEG